MSAWREQISTIFETGYGVNALNILE